MKDFKCPYCAKNSYSKTSKNAGRFSDWKAVRYHIPSCDKNNGEYTIDELYGPIHWSEFTRDKYYITNTYPRLRNLASILKIFRRKGYLLTNMVSISSDEILFNYVKVWVEKTGTIPSPRDWYNSDYPKPRQVIEKFKTWNNFIKSSGFTPNIQNGYGIDTYGLDNHLYRSKAEAYFADTYLYGKYEYVIEPKYPSPYCKYYDWYLPSLDLYIELDGKIRPHTVKEKLKINNNLNRNCVFIPTSDIYNKEKIVNIIDKR
jgi:hypothetical protein